MGKIKYDRKWEQRFSWVTADPWHEDRARCKHCKTDMNAMLGSLRAHSQGAGHRARTLGQQQPAPLGNRDVQRAELKLAAMAICHSKLRTLDHLSQFVGEAGKGSHLAGVKLHITKESI